MNNFFFDKICEFFPECEEEFDVMTKTYGEFLETVAIEDIVMPKLIKLLKNDQDIQRLKDFFAYIEAVVTSDERLREILSITMMEKMGDDIEILAIAKKYMGEESAKLQMEADMEIGRNM